MLREDRGTLKIFRSLEASGFKKVAGVSCGINCIDLSTQSCPMPDLSKGGELRMAGGPSLLWLSNGAGLTSQYYGAISRSFHKILWTG